jgi:hypothetical protein
MSDPDHVIIVGDAPGPPGGDCGCCAGAADGLLALTNRPGLSAIAYRVGTHARFKQAMLSALSDVDLPALARLRTRDSDDFSVALIDAWATVSDVLTFYQERVANESYLRTATERVSVIDLAELIGFRPRPGVAAATALAFTLDEAAGAPEQAVQQTTIEHGARVQSIPGPDQQAQTFETIETITARIEWNAMKPRRREPGGLNLSGGVAYLSGTATNLKPGDIVIFINEQRIANWQAGFFLLRRLTTADPEHDEDRTRITFEPFSGGNSAGPFHGFALRLRASLFGYNAPDPKTLHSEIKTNFHDSIDSATGDWAFLINDKTIFLDTTYPQILRDSWLVLSRPEGAQLFSAKSMAEAARAAYAMSGKATQITLDNDKTLFSFTGSNYRGTAVFAQSEELAFSERPITEPVFDDTIVLDRVVTDLTPGRLLFVRGKRARVKVVGVGLSFAITGTPNVQTLQPDATLRLLAKPTPVAPGSSQKMWRLRDDDNTEGVVKASDSDFAYVVAAKGDEIVVERAAVKRSELADGRHTRLVLNGPLLSAYDRWSTEIVGNVALATHGETVSEILGSGNAGEVFQRFTLKQTPVTYVGASSATGAASSLEVRVSDVLWREVPTFYGCGPQDRVYVTRIGDDGKMTVEFGDGRSGARLPSGQDNIRAVYRKGIGRDGLVEAGQLSMLMSRPLGVNATINPQAAAGAADPESLDDARSNAPVGVLTLDRAVSLRDYEDFARGFAGVSKALATWSWDGRMRRVFVTVAGADGAEIAPDSDLYQHLLNGLRNAGDPLVAFEVKSFRTAHFQVGMRVKVGDLPAEKVLAEVETALRNRFGFAARSFGQPVNMSEVIAVAQGVTGVEAIDLDRLYRTTPPADQPPLNPRLPAALPGIGLDGHMAAAELLTLVPGPLDELEVMP